MEKRAIVDTILESLRDEVSQFVEEESKIDSSIEYEERVLSLAREFARKLTLETQGKIAKSRNSKKKS